MDLISISQFFKSNNTFVEFLPSSILWRIYAGGQSFCRDGLKMVYMSVWYPLSHLFQLRFLVSRPLYLSSIIDQDILYHLYFSISFLISIQNDRVYYLYLSIVMHVNAIKAINYPFQFILLHIFLLSKLFSLMHGHYQFIPLIILNIMLFFRPLYQIYLVLFS